MVSEELFRLTVPLSDAKPDIGLAFLPLDSGTFRLPFGVVGILGELSGLDFLLVFSGGKDLRLPARLGVSVMSVRVDVDAMESGLLLLLAGLSFVGVLGVTAGRLFLSDVVDDVEVCLGWSDFVPAGGVTRTLAFEIVDAADVLRDRMLGVTSEAAVKNVELSVIEDDVDVGRTALELGRKPVVELTPRRVDVWERTERNEDAEDFGRSVVVDPVREDTLRREGFGLLGLEISNFVTPSEVREETSE